MRLFLDSADPVELHQALTTGVISGVTTNPTLMARAGVTDVVERVRIITNSSRWAKLHLSVELVHLSVELVQTDPDEMVDEAEAWACAFSNITIKVPIKWEWLDVVRRLGHLNIPVNVTACMTYNQGVLAAAAGAQYVSMFWNRIRDGGGHPPSVVGSLRRTFDREHVATEIIVGSIRSTEDVEQAFANGAHIVTVPYKIMVEMSQHPKTDEIIAQFAKDAGR